MKIVKYLFWILVLLSTESMGQVNTSIYDQWFDHMVHAEEAMNADLTDEAQNQYQAAYAIATESLYEHVAYIVTVDLIIASYEIFRDMEPIGSLIRKVQTRMDSVYGAEDLFVKTFNQNLHVGDVESGKIRLADLYFQTLNKVYESNDKSSSNANIMVKELMLYSYVFSNHESTCHYAYSWYQSGDSDFNNYIDIAFVANYEMSVKFQNEGNVENSLLHIENAYHFMQSNSEIKSTYGIDVVDRVFFGNIDLKRYEAALGYEDDLKEIYNQAYGENSKELAFVFNEIAFVYEGWDNLKLAENYYSMAVLFYLISGELEHEYYVPIRDNYVALLDRMNRHSELIKFYENEGDAYSRMEILNIDYIKSLREYNMFILKDPSMGSVLIKNYNIIIDYYYNRKVLDKTYILSVIGLASVYNDNEYYDRLFELMEKHRSSLILAQKESGFSYGLLYRNLAIYTMTSELKDEVDVALLTNRQIQDLDKAIDYFIREEVDYSEYADLLNIKGVALCVLGQEAEGVAILRTNKTNLEKYSLTNTDDYTTVLSLLSTYSSIKGDEDKAGALIQQSIDAFIESGDTLGPNYFSANQSYIRWLLKEENSQEAIPLILESYDYIIRDLNARVKGKSSGARDFKINSTALTFLSELQYYNYLLKDESAALSDIAIEAALLSKNLTLSVSSNILNKLRSLNDEYLNGYIDIYQKRSYLNRSMINLLRQQNSSENERKIKEQEKEIEATYTELISSYFEKFDEPLLTSVNHRDFELERNSVYIDYVRAINLKDEFTYLAYVYFSGIEQPSVINLGLESDLENILSNGNIKQLNYVARGSISNRSSTSQMGKALYDMVWNPIASHLGTSDIIYFSLAGLLNKIPIAAIQNDSGELLMDKYELVQLSTSAPLIARSEVAPDFSKLVIYGGVNYDMDLDIQLDNRFEYLPGTMKESESIQSIVPTAQTYTDIDATERSFRALDQRSPSVIHLATHGFYFDFEKSPETSFGKFFKMDENPLARTGLLLANANEGINGVLDKRIRDGIDGVLTSLEIALLDLRSTDLVVLSACETGLGDIDGNEGVYGLQRAFKMAGVDMIMMSLWEIPDKETQEFMTKFYSLCLTDNVRSAFRDTQQYMKGLYPDKPEIWAAFVLVE